MVAYVHLETEDGNILARESIISPDPRTIPEMIMWENHLFKLYSVDGKNHYTYRERMCYFIQKKGELLCG